MSIIHKKCIFQVLACLLMATGTCIMQAASAVQKTDKVQPQKIRVGYSIALIKINEQSMADAKSLGISCIEVSGISALIGKDRQFKYT